MGCLCPLCEREEICLTVNFGKIPVLTNFDFGGLFASFSHHAGPKAPLPQQGKKAQPQLDNSTIRWGWFADCLCFTWAVSRCANHVSSSLFWILSLGSHMCDSFRLFVLQLIQSNRCSCYYDCLLQWNRCITPCWIGLFLYRLEGGVDINGKPTWCEDSFDTDTTSGEDHYDPLSQLEYDDEILRYHDDYEVVVLSLTSFLLLSILYTFLDVFVGMGIWSAAGIGTPTDPKKRDNIMRSLIWVKVTFINLLLMGTFTAGILFVVYGRQHNYGCGVDSDIGTSIFEVSTYTTWWTFITQHFHDFNINPLISTGLCLLLLILCNNDYICWRATPLALCRIQPAHPSST